MALTLLTNISSLEAQKNVTATQVKLEDSVGRLSSGMRIRKASDDSAGLAISSRLASQLNGLQQAQRNANDGISMIQTAEAGLAGVNSLLTRMRELAVQSANGGTLSTSDRLSVNTEFTALQSEITRIVNVTAFNGQKLIDGSLSTGTSFQVGTFNTANDRIVITILSSDANTLGINTGLTDVSTQNNAINSIDLVSSAINLVSTQRASIGASQRRMAVTVDNLADTYTNLAAANSRIADVDVASETANLTRNQILLQAGISVLAQANQQPTAALALLGR